MTIHRRVTLKAVLLGMAAFLLPIAAQAAEGFATANVNMRSGPSTGYPAVTVIPVGTPVDIHGCLPDIPWCDVSFYNGRGWVAGRYIQAEYRRSRVVLEPEIYVSLGIPLIGFELGNYWDRNYRDRDFYRQRDHFRRDWDQSRNDRRPRSRNEDSRFERPRQDWDQSWSNRNDRGNDARRERDRQRADRRNDNDRSFDRRSGDFNWDENAGRATRRDGQRPDADRASDRSRDVRRPRCRPGDEFCG